MKTFDEVQWARLNERRNKELPFSVLDIYQARAILREGLEDVENVARFARASGTLDTDEITESLIDLAARCQQTAEDLNLIEPQMPDALVEKHKQLVLAFRIFMNMIASRATPEKPLQRGGEPCVSATIEQFLLDDIVDKIAQYE